MLDGPTWSSSPWGEEMGSQSKLTSWTCHISELWIWSWDISMEKVESAWGRWGRLLMSVLVFCTLTHVCTVMNTHTHNHAQPKPQQKTKQNKPIMRHHSTNWRLGHLKKSKSTNFGEKWRKRTPIYCWWDFKMVQKHCQFFKNQT